MAKKADTRDHAPNIVNRQARFEYSILDTWTAGLMLTGSEVKSLRDGQAQIADAYCAFGGKGGQALLLLNATIAPYAQGAYANHDPKRPRQLLLKSQEMDRLRTRLQETGITLVPLKLFWTERGIAKLEIGLAKGKKAYDKRDTIKQRDQDRALRRGDD